MYCVEVAPNGETEELMARSVQLVDREAITLEHPVLRCAIDL